MFLRVAASLLFVTAGVATSGCALEMARRLRATPSVDVDEIRAHSEGVGSAVASWAESSRRDHLRVLGIGEPTHGTREARVFARDVLASLSASKQKVLVFGEWCDVEGNDLNEYLHDAGSTKQPNVGGPLFWSATMRGMWDASKASIATTHHDVKVYGMRSCTLEHQGRSLARALQGVSPSIAEDVARAADASDTTAMRRAIDSIPRGDDVPSDVRANLVYQQHLVEQAMRRFSVTSLDDDRFMAENIRYVVEHLDPDADVAIVLAHNGHVTAAQSIILQNSREMNLLRLGGHLRVWKRDDYLAVGVLTGDGSFCAMRKQRPRSRVARSFRIEHPAGAIEASLSRVAERPWSVALDTAAAAFPSPAYHFEGGYAWGWPMTVHRGTAYIGEHLATAFDVLVFYPSSTGDQVPGCE